MGKNHEACSQYSNQEVWMGRKPDFSFSNKIKNIGPARRGKVSSRGAF
jgi:hypothetical protein